MSTVQSLRLTKPCRCRCIGPNFRAQLAPASVTKMCSNNPSVELPGTVCIMCRHPLSASNSCILLDSRSGSNAKLCSTSPVSCHNSCSHLCNPCISSNSQLRQRHLRPSRTLSSCTQASSPFEVLPLFCKFAHRISKMSFNSNLLLTFFLYAILLASQVTCEGGTFELRLDRFSNELNRDASGQCCALPNGTDPASDSICEEKCQTFFRVCFTNYQAKINPKQDDCAFGQKVTPVLHDGLISGHIVQFPFNFSWPGTFSLIIEGWNNASAFAPAKHDKTVVLIGRYYENGALNVSDTWTPAKENQTALHFSYRVRCKENYYGNCSTKCTPRDNVYGHYNCGPKGERICHPGWSGPYCEKPVCRACQHGQGDCIGPDQCRCRSGWTGPDCNQCQKYPNCKHGTCQKPWECICEEGWGGLLCNSDLNYCTNHKPCKNNGTCSNTGEGSFTCTCPVGFTGKYCQVKVDICDSSPCKNGATCKSNAASSDYTCQCSIGFQGHNCEHPVSACDRNPCENEGTCVDGPSGYLCVCKNGFSGKKCQVRQKNCQPTPCLNGGECVANSTLAPEEGYTCQCRAGFSGAHCEVNINDCESNPCLNGGSCKDEINSFRCFCVPGFVGELCQVNVDDCLMKPCANGGICTDRINDYMCSCPAGFAGKDCSINLDDCASSPCQNKGICKDLINDFECSCAPNFFGANCEYSNSSQPFNFAESFQGENPFSSRQLAMVIFCAISLLVFAIFIVALYLCNRWKRRDHKMKTRRDEAEARRQNEHNAVMSGLNNKCLEQCLNPSAANVIVNDIDRAPSMHHLNKALNYQSKVTNEYVYGRQLEKSGTLQKDYKSLSPYKTLNTEMQVKLSLDDPYNHTYEHIHKPSNLLTNNLSNQQIYQKHAPKQSNLDIFASQTVSLCPDKSDFPSVMPSRSSDFAPQPHVEPRGKAAHSNLQNNIQFAATLQRFQGCRSNSVYVIENHYSQPIYSDPKKLQATEV